MSFKPPAPVNYLNNSNGNNTNNGGGFQLPQQHNVQLKPVRPPPQPTQLQQQNTSPVNSSPRDGQLPPSPGLSSQGSSNIYKQSPLPSPNSSPNVARKVVPPPPQSYMGGGPSSAPPTHLPPQPPNNSNIAPTPPNFVKKLSPSSSPILPKRTVPTSPSINPINNNNTASNPPPPPIVHLPPPPPASMLSNSGGIPPPLSNSNNNNNINTSANYPPPIVHLPSPPPISNSMPPPPPPVSMLSNSGGMPPPPPQLNRFSSSGGLPPPPNFVNSNSNNNSSSLNNSTGSLNSSGGIPPPPFLNLSPQLNSSNHFKPPPPIAPTRSASLDPKQMSQFIRPPPPTSPSSAGSSASSLQPFLANNPSAMGGISPMKRNSLEASQGNNKRLSNELNTMLVNRLQHGLSPPVSSPYFDEKILSNQTKSAELKEKRDNDEKERRDREKVKKEKEECDKKEKKEKKEKEEQEKKDKKKKEEQEKQEKKDKKKKEEQEKKDKSSKSSKSSDSSSTNTNIFGNTLPQIMILQKERFPQESNLPYPLILKLLAEGVINLNGPYTEGIFRVTGSGTEVNRLKKQINEHDFTFDTQDPHVLAGLLKLWLRELTQPVIPTELYYDCIKSRSKDEVLRIFNSLPDLNKEVLNYLFAFLKNVSQPQYAAYSKMDIDNVAMVFAPGLLRCPTTDSNMLLNSQYEKDFIKCLLELSP